MNLSDYGISIAEMSMPVNLVFQSYTFRSKSMFLTFVPGHSLEALTLKLLTRALDKKVFRSRCSLVESKIIVKKRARKSSSL